MKGIAKDICPKCKHCEGLDRFRTMYSCKHYNKYPDSSIGIDSEIECCNFEEVNMNKVEGKVGDFCPKCKNCKGITRESDGVHVWLTEIECEDPYDGMTKTLDADSSVCCSMFELKKEKESFNLNMPREAIKAIAKLNNIISELEKEKYNHLKGIERLKKSQEKLQNQVKNLQTTNEESYKREEKLEDKVHKLERRLLDENKRFNRLDTELLTPLARVLYPREAKICKPYSEVLEDVKELNKISTYYDRYKTFTDKVQSLLFQDDHTYEFDEIIEEIKNLKVEAEENETMYNDLKYWKERCHKAEIDIATLNYRVDVLNNKKYNYLKPHARILELENAVNKLQSGEYDDILAKDIEIKSLQAKYEDAMSGWNHTMELHDKLKQESDNLTESNEKLEDKVHKLERRLLDESKRRALDNEFLMSLAHVLYHGEKVFKSYDDILKDIQLLKLANYNLKDDNKGLAERNKSLKSDIDTLQNAVLEIHNIAQVAYNDIDND